MGLTGLLLCGGLAIVLAVAARRPDPAELYEQVLNALEADRIDAAEAGLSRLSGLRLPTVLDWGLRARLAIARGRTPEALSALAKIPEEHPLSPWAHLRAGQLHSRARRFRRAEAELRCALDREPHLVVARRELIYIVGLQLRRLELDRQFALLAGDATLSAHEVWVWCMSRELVWWTPAELSPILEEALRNDPDDRWSRLALAENLQRTGHGAAAGALLMALSVSDPDAQAARARLELDGGDADSAAAIAAEGADDHPGLAALRGRLALARGDGHSAVRWFERVLAAEPDDRRAIVSLGQAWVLAGAPDRAKPYVTAAARINELNGLLLAAEHRTNQSDPALWHRLGAACEAAGRPRQARSWYVLCIDRDPLDAAAQQALHRLNEPRHGSGADNRVVAPLQEP